LISSSTTYHFFLTNASEKISGLRLNASLFSHYLPAKSERSSLLRNSGSDDLENCFDFILELERHFLFLKIFWSNIRLGGWQKTINLYLLIFGKLIVLNSKIDFHPIHEPYNLKTCT